MIEAYGNGGFTIDGVRSLGSVLVFPGRVDAWDVVQFADITLDSLSGVLHEDPAVELLLIGCGASPPMPSAILRHGLSEAGVVADFMNSGAACRTFNVLLAEGRRVAAAVIAVS